MSSKWQILVAHKARSLSDRLQRSVITGNYRFVGVGFGLHGNETVPMCVWGLGTRLCVYVVRSRSLRSNWSTAVMAGSRIIEGLPSWKKSMSILISGLVGSGKSSLTNTLLNRNEAQVGSSPYRETQSVQVYHLKYKSLSVEIWDSPGLGGDGDDDEYIREMKASGCDNADLMFFCVNMNDIRVRQTHMDAIRNLTNGFGKKIWSKAIFVMTSANLVVERLVEMNGSYYSFNQHLGEWRSRLVQAVEKAGVDRDMALCIPVVPVGLDIKQALAGHDHWVKALWCTCVCRVREQLQRKGVLFCMKYVMFSCSK